MTGATEFLLIAVCLVSLIAFTTDLRFRKIHNVLTLPAMAVGVAGNLFLAGVPGATQAVLGILLGFVLYGWMFAIKVMGAGDVKLLMAYGALGGTSFVLDVAIVGVLLGGVFALVLLIAQRRFGSFWTRVQVFLLSVSHRGLGIERPGLDHKLKMPFGVTLSIAAIWVVVANPLQHWGLRLWS